MSIDQFLERLRFSGVLTAEEFESLKSQAQNADGAEAFAAKLVAQEKLTEYQAKMLFEGRGKPLALGDYVILHPIGSGGMGQVFKARHRRMHRVVALKVLPAAVAENETAVRRFEREMVAAARLAHRNIVVAHDAREEAGIHYLVMEYVAGDDLARVVKKYGPLEVERAIDYVMQAALGLAHAHAQGVIHRDIKPSNLLVDAQGTVKVLDLGIARFEGAPAGGPPDGLTATGSMMGTADFMSPEQALDTKSADARSDVYSLGCTLFFLLAGHPMYEGDSYMKRVVAHREQPIPSLAAERNDLPEGLVAVYERMVAKRPDDRIQSMDQVVRELEVFRGALVGAPSPASGSESDWAKKGMNTVVPPPPPTLLAGRTVAVQGNSGTRGESPAFPNPTAPPIVAERSDEALKESKSFRRIALLVAACAAPFLVLLIAGGIAVSRGWFNQPPVSNDDPKVGERPGVPRTFENSLKMKLVFVPPGEFEMGSPDSEADRDLDETLHHVRLTCGFYLAAHEVTVAQFREFVTKAKHQTEPESDGLGGWGWNEEAGKFEQHADYTWQNPGFAQTDDHPVVNVSWHDATAFCDWLSKAEGRTYRLPTEAEWEYACRAGTKTPFVGGEDPETLPKFGNVSDSSAREKFPIHPTLRARDGYIFTAPVGKFQPNAFGLFDMHGNVWEWCADRYAEAYEGPGVDPRGPDSGWPRVLRGGSYLNYDKSHTRSADRKHNAPTYRDNDMGFRIACDEKP